MNNNKGLNTDYLYAKGWCGFSIEPKVIKIHKKIASSITISIEDGNKIYKEIDKRISKYQKIILDFIDISLVSHAFLNAAIGQLYSKYNSDFLNQFISIENMDANDRELLRTVIENSKQYFKNKRCTCSLC